MMSAIKAMQKLERIAADTFRESVTTRVDKIENMGVVYVVLRVAYGEFDLSHIFSPEKIEALPDIVLKGRMASMAMELGRDVFIKDGQ